VFFFLFGFKNPIFFFPLAKFRGAISTILVATEIAARGLDIPKVNFVLNFDFSKTLASYIHRAGRTARVGRQGICMSLICEKDDTSLVRQRKLFKLNTN
jgi:superfamily II DNA/RNA helicase